MKEKAVVQVGFTAARDLGTGEFLPSIPLYVDASDMTAESANGLCDAIGKILAEKMKQYMDGCRAAGVSA